MAGLGLHWYTMVFCSFREWGRLFVAGPRARRFQSLWHTGLVAQQHVESSWTRDQTHVLCIGRQILNNWTTRAVLHYGLLQDIEYSPLCYTVGPCCLCILCVIVCIC